MGDGKELTDILARVRAHGSEDPRGRITAVRFVEPAADTLSDAERLANRAGALLARSITAGTDGIANRFERLHDEIEIAHDGGVLVVVELSDGSRFGHLFDNPTAPDDSLYRLCRAVGVDLDVDPLESAIVGERVPVEQRAGRWQIDIDELVE